MLVYPQLSHFPLIKRRNARTVLNRLADGRSIRMADAAGAATEWRLEYAELTDDEVQTLEEFFMAAEGSLHPFTYIDPMANLLDAAAWFAGPLMNMTGGPEQWHLSNSGAGPQSMTQTIPGPPGFLYTFSGSVRAEQDCTVTVMAGSRRAEREVSATWERFALTSQTDDPTFGLELPSGSSLELNNVQVEAQAGASVYRKTMSGGIYEDARLRDDALEIVTAGPNRHMCTVNIIHANHI